MLKIRRIFTIIILVGILLSNSQWAVASAPPPPPTTTETDSPPPPVEEIDPTLETALQDMLHTVTKARSEVLAFVLFDVEIDHVEYSEDGQTALLWLALIDPDTHEVIAAEPGLAIAKLDSAQKDLASGESPWEITLQSDSSWTTDFNALPKDLITEDLSMRFASAEVLDEAEPKDVKAVYTGYKLPWAGGLGKYLSGSIGHFLIYNSCSITDCRYAYDFADGTMFPLLAARGGTVWKYKYDCPNYETSCSNYLVLKDESTSPTTYQLYLHNAYDSLPQELRQVGAQVVQGQYIGNVDDTGYSSGHHLHFHVHTNPTSYWGSSVDIRFDDVDINDGTPRTKYEAQSWPAYGTGYHSDNKFVSGNYGAYPPSANLIIPSDGEEINSSTLLIGGTASDDIAVTKIEIMARPFGEDWRVLGPVLTDTTFLTEINLCDAGFPSGPVDLYVRAFDYEGNQTQGTPGFRTILNNAACVGAAEPPACEPTDNQVAVFSDQSYGGSCQIFNVGDYANAASWSTVGDNNVESILVGNNVRAVVYDNSQNDSWSWGRAQTYEADDPNFEDDLVGLNRTSAMRVMSKTNLPAAPIINSLTNDFRLSNTSAMSFVIDFVSYGATQYRASLSGPVNKTLALTKNPSWSVGSLPAGNYTLQVWGKNSAGERNTTTTFTIASGTLSNTTTVTAPYQADFESGEQNWLGAGLWHRTQVNISNRNTAVWVFNDGTDIADSNIGGGDLTSPPITIPASGTYYLRFDYLSHTESFYPYWDQRWVQISVNGGAFENLMQMTLDPTNVWLTSPAVNLSAYAGKTIRVRFHFDIVDSFYNENYVGWMIDNIAITNQAPSICQSTEPNDTLSTATQFPASNEVFAHICPNGDLDYYKFTGADEEDLALNVDAIDFGSMLDPYLFLMDANGNILASNDDENYAEGQRDSFIAYKLPAQGTYYAMIKSWEHPGVGGEDYYYALRLSRGDLTPPKVSFLVPYSSLIPSVSFPIQADAVDYQSDVSRVDFYYRDGNTFSASWKLIGSDSNGADGWSVYFNPAVLTQVKNSMFYIEAYDVFNNQSGALLVVDGFGEGGNPVSALTPFNGTLSTTLVNLTWWANDSVASFDIQSQVNGADWQNLVSGIPGGTRQYVYFGSMGNSYNFRIRAVDFSGVVEDYPANPEVLVTINNCTPDSFEASNEDTLANAVNLPLNTNQTHNFCQTTDVDWVKFNAVAGEKYMIAATAQGSTTAVNIDLYTMSGTRLTASAQPTAYGKSTALVWQAQVTETVYVQLQPPDNRLAGDAVVYRVWVGEPQQVFLPVIGR